MDGRALAYLRAKEDGTWDPKNPPPPRGCACGATEATRRHLAWHCPLEPLELGESAPPENTAAEGLLVRLAPVPPLPVEQPTRPQDVIPDGLVAALLDAAQHTTGRALVATDGGSVGEGRDLSHRRGAVGIAVRSATGDQLGFRLPRPGLDQTAYGAELWGLWVITAALAEADSNGDTPSREKSDACDGCVTVMCTA